MDFDTIGSSLFVLNPKKQRLPIFRVRRVPAIDMAAIKKLL